jgi:hypothetical protein
MEIVLVSKAVTQQQSVLMLALSLFVPSDNLSKLLIIALSDIFLQMK